MEKFARLFRNEEIMEFIETSNKKYIADYLWNRFGTHTFFPQGDFLPFEEGREFVRKLGLKNLKKWREYTKLGKKPNNIPADPSKFYKDEGWISWGDFLGTGVIYGKNKQFLSFEEAKKLVKSLGIKSCREWRKCCQLGKRPNEIPANPNSTYKNEWTNWGDFLGTGYINYKDRTYLPFEEVKNFVKKLELKGKEEWREYCKSEKKLNDIPVSVRRVYKNEWTNWGDFLGTGYICVRNRKFLSFKKARAFVRKLKLKSSTEWWEYCKSGNKPSNIPYAVFRIYKDKEWISWPNFLGTKK